MIHLPNIDILVLSTKPVRDALAPTIEFEIQVANRSAEAIQDCLVNCEAYMKFPEKPIYWGTTSISVGSFNPTSPANRKLRLPCGYDANLTVSRYLEMVGEGEIPIELHFWGTCFWGTQTAPIPLKTQSTSIPTSTWRSLVLAFYRNARWVMITPETLKTLEELRDEWQLHTYDEVIQELIKSRKEESKK